MKNARAKRAKILFFIVKYANLWGFCYRRRRGCLSYLLERFSIAFTANDKRQAEISLLPKTREIYLVSAYILPVSYSYGASTKNREIS